MTVNDDVQAALAELESAQRAFATRYPGPSPERQPVHTVYGGAHLFRAETSARLGASALEALDLYGRDLVEFALGVGFVSDAPALAAGHAEISRQFSTDEDRLRIDNPAAWLACAVYRRVRDKLEREPVEDFRIDFEDGFGVRPDGEEDELARRAALEVARGMSERKLPPFVGIRIKPLSTEWARRAERTLGVFLEALLGASGGQLPPGFIVTLPKVTLVEQPRLLVRLLEQVERRHALPPRSVRVELMVELTQALMGADGRCPLPELVQACEGRCLGAHLGTYDFTASCQLTAAQQRMSHPWCDLAKGMMLLALAGTGVFLSDGATNVMPVGPHRGADLSPAERAGNRVSVHAAWRASHDNVRHSLEGGFYQGWDLHPAQLPVRYAATYAFFLEGFAPAAERLSNFIDQAARATLAGGVFDDAATGQGLLNYFLRALNCGAISEQEVARTGLSPKELQLRSFAQILESRRAPT